MIANQTLEILFEDAHIIVCKKPAGIATQTKSVGSMDMEHLIKRHLYMTSSVKSEPYLAVIHRLDQPVSGILVFAKTPAAAKELNKQLQSKGFGKYYKALVTGDVPREAERKPVIHYMKKDNTSNTSSICDPSDPQAKKAFLTYKIIDTPNQKDIEIFSHSNIPDISLLTLLEIKLDTGRHHQIRVQMAALGCPIWGDTKYASTAPTENNKWVNIALCAYKLDFMHPITKKPFKFSL